MPRFVVLEHDHPCLHWDLMLENQGVLRTWRLPAPPRDEPAAATALGDHRLMYLDYEGPVSGDRGVVRRWDTGECVVLELSDEVCRARLLGANWRGEVELRRGAGDQWTVAWRAD